LKGKLLTQPRTHNFDSATSKLTISSEYVGQQSRSETTNRFSENNLRQEFTQERIRDWDSTANNKSISLNPLGYRKIGF
jgi:hypothetical protein